MTSYTLRSTEQDGTIREVELTPEGQTTQRESAIPQPRDEAA